jgi:hypothetical protein
MKKLLYMIIGGMLLSACTKEIDFDFHDDDPVVVVEAKVTNEGRSVVISRSRSVSDSVHAQCLQGASVMISSADTTTVLAYDAAAGCYHSTLPGTPGQTYRLSVDFEGKHYEASATMKGAAPITSSAFSWIRMNNQRVLCYEMWADDPEPDVRNYYWFKMNRTSHHPHLEGRRQTEPYGWDLFDDRGCPPGTLFLDWIILYENTMDEDKEDDWKTILYDGDSITVQLMTVDRQAYNYLYELRTGQNNGANPRSNISGGCLGYFAAGSITYSDTIVFERKNIEEWKE